jgi:large subunit ribosomal protein L20
MPRVKRGTHSIKKRRTLLAKVKGARFDIGNKERAARTAWLHAGVHAFTGRRDKKNDFRRLWQVRIGAALEGHELSYSRFIDALKKHNINLNRKMLATLAAEEPETFTKLVEQVQSR